jgi:aspartyl aminopeptidase
MIGLMRKRTSAWQKDTSKVFKFAEGYMEFLAKAKTERAATKVIAATLEKNGFKELSKSKTLKAGDKVYHNQKGKSIIAAVIGKQNDRFNLVGSHIDSPRLDLKPNPLFEDSSIALLKTHYYGGIKKYQWVNVDLALYGVIHTKDGKKIELCIGEEDDEPRFLMSDLLPHLSKKQMEKKADEIIEGEQLNIFIGNIPLEAKEGKEKVKANILKILNRDYGIVEDDFSFAELNFIPAGKPREIGFDRSLIAGYGQDDKSCSYANLMSILDVKTPAATAIAYFSDKEEIGSYGNTGAQSYILLDFAEQLVQKLGLKSSPKEMLRQSKAISADVSAGLDPSFHESHEERNAAIIGEGVVIEKYTGSGGKYSANDTHAEYMNEIRQLMLKNDVRFQASEIGKIDIGGGGTIALYLSRFGMDTVDAGPAVLGMHSPREIISKVDLYESYKLYRAFLA